MAADSPQILIGRRIRAARERAGLSQTELGDRLDRTATSISYWENGQRSPGVDDLLQLAGALDIEVTDLLPSPHPPLVIARAEAATLSVKDVEAVASRIVEQQSSLPDEDWAPPRYPPQAGDAADLARAESGEVVPPIDVNRIYKVLGIKLVKEKMESGLSGLVIYVEGYPIVTVNRAHNIHRRRFSAAHELGHILLGHIETFHVDLSGYEGVPPGYNWRHERSANEFAASLLMPAELLRKDVQVGTCKTLRGLARAYKVSTQAMSIRLRNLALLEELD